MEELVLKFLQGDGLAPETPARRRPRSRVRLATMMLAHALTLQVLQGQFGHLAGAHQQDGLAGQLAEDLPGQADRGIADADGVVADAGFAAHPFGHGEGLVQQAVQNGAGGLVLGGLPVGLLDLPQDLGLAQDHGIEAGGYPEEVLHRLRTLVDVQGLLQVGRRDLRGPGEKGPQPGRAASGAGATQTSSTRLQVL